MNAGRLFVVVLVAVLIAGGVFFLTRMMQPVQQQQTVVIKETVPSVGKGVLVATTDVPAGTLLKKADTQFAFRTWPEESTDQEIYVIEGTDKIEDFDGAVVRTGVRKGEPLTRSNVIKPGERGFLSAVLKPGMRAVSMAVNAGTGVAGFVFPGDHVDLILSHAVILPQGKDKISHNLSETFLHNLRVVAIDQVTNDLDATPKVSGFVTVEATPEQSERIALAQQMGELRLVLRSLVLDDSGKAVDDNTVETETTPLLGAAGGTITLPTDGARTFTLDSDLSQIVAPPNGSSSGQSGTVQVILGDRVQDVSVK